MGMKAIVVFLLSGLAEIGGGYLIWLWLRDGRSAVLGLLGAAALFLYGVIATWQVFPFFGRVYAAYGGVFIVLSVLWGWLIDKQAPDAYDWLGAAVCVAGVAIMVLAPRH